MILKSRQSRKSVEKYIVLEVRSNLWNSGQVSLVGLVALETVTQVPSTEHQKGKNSPHDVVTQALPVFCRFLQGATATSKGGPVYGRCEDPPFPGLVSWKEPWEVLLSILDLPLSCHVTAIEHWFPLQCGVVVDGGTSKSEPQKVDLCKHCLLSNSGKGWVWMVMARPSEYLR